MIATNEAADVLRHGWQDAASTLAADVPEVAELLAARLEMAIATKRLDERHLLDTILEVESVTFRAGSPSSEALARRLRHTVYEYLLALDATRPSETAKASVDQPAPVSNSPMVGAEEVAALGHASSSRTGEGVDGHRTAAEAVEAAPEGAAPPEATAEVEVAEDTPSAGSPVSRRRFALRRRRRRGADGAASDAAGDVVSAPEASEAAQLDDEAAAAPNWQFTPPDELTEPATVDEQPDDEPIGAVDAEAEASDGAGADPAIEESEPAQAAEPAAIEPHGATGRGFVAPRAGFHIVEDAPAHGPSSRDDAPLEMPAFAADELAASQAGEQASESSEGEPATTDVAAAQETAPDVVAPDHAGSEFLGWRATPAASNATPPAEDAPAKVAPAEAAPAAARPEPKPASNFNVASAPSAANQPVAKGNAPEPEAGDATSAPQADDAEAQHGWRVRRHGEARSGRPGAHALAVPQVEDDPFENNSKLSETRRRIEDRLRRKRCDEAAALLQQIAQETGGRAVAELAMNAGDRCRALGKSNAALNCYLAAARSDPVYELPLSRLADICIDNQDTELAVSYLERIARLYRFRGEDKAALRMYRRIATIAPYREDVLTLLMNAQSTGQLE